MSIKDRFVKREAAPGPLGAPIPKKLVVVICKPGEKPAAAEIANDSHVFREIVGGTMESWSFFRTKAFNYRFGCNEFFAGLPYNRIVGNTAVHGTFFVTKTGIEGGEFLSLTDEEVYHFLLSLEVL